MEYMHIRACCSAGMQWLPRPERASGRKPAEATIQFGTSEEQLYSQHAPQLAS